MITTFECVACRCLLAVLFDAGAAQKAIDPDPAQALLAGYVLPEWLVWPALAFNMLAASLLIAGKFLRALGRAMAIYCLVTSVFHFVLTDPWQMLIMIINWALAGGCLMLSASSYQRT